MGLIIKLTSGRARGRPGNQRIQEKEERRRAERGSSATNTAQASKRAPVHSECRRNGTKNGEEGMHFTCLHRIWCPYDDKNVALLFGAHRQPPPPRPPPTAANTILFAPPTTTTTSTTTTTATTTTATTTALPGGGEHGRRQAYPSSLPVMTSSSPTSVVMTPTTTTFDDASSAFTASTAADAAAGGGRCGGGGGRPTTPALPPPPPLTTEAAGRYDWDIKPMPSKSTVVDIGVNFTSDDMTKIRQGFIPTDMGDKWFIYYDTSIDILHLHRSSTGICVYSVKFVGPVNDDGSYRATASEVNRNPDQYSGVDDRKDERLCLQVIGAVLLKRFVPSLDADQADQSQWSLLGNNCLPPNGTDRITLMADALFDDDCANAKAAHLTTSIRAFLHTGGASVDQGGAGANDNNATTMRRQDSGNGGGRRGSSRRGLFRRKNSNNNNSNNNNNTSQNRINRIADNRVHEVGDVSNAVIHHLLVQVNSRDNSISQLEELIEMQRSVIRTQSERIEELNGLLRDVEDEKVEARKNCENISSRYRDAEENERFFRTSYRSVVAELEEMKKRRVPAHAPPVDSSSSCARSIESSYFDDDYSEAAQSKDVASDDNTNHLHTPSRLVFGMQKVASISAAASASTSFYEQEDAASDSKSRTTHNTELEEIGEEEQEVEEVEEIREEEEEEEFEEEEGLHYGGEVHDDVHVKTEDDEYQVHCDDPRDDCNDDEQDEDIKQKPRYIEDVEEIEEVEEIDEIEEEEDHQQQQPNDSSHHAHILHHYPPRVPSPVAPLQ